MGGVLSVFSSYGGVAAGGDVTTGGIGFGGNGKNTLTGSGATGPASWFVPNLNGIGDGYWLQVNRTGGTGGVNFSQTSGSWVNIGTGITITAVGGAGLATGTYKIASDSAGANVVVTGNLSCNNTI
jgi:hypothetical protein